MDFINLVFITTTDIYSTTGNATQLMLSQLKSMDPGKFLTIGFLKAQDKWQRTQATTAHYALALAVQHVSQNVFGYGECFAVRIGKGIQRLPTCSEADHTVVIYWRRSLDDAQVFEADTNGSVNLRQIIGQDFEQYNTMQLLCTQDVEPQAKLENIINPAADDTNSDAATASDNQPQDPDRLSAIPEEDEHDIDLDALAHEAFFNIKEEGDEIFAAVADISTDERIHVQDALHYFTVDADPAL